MTRELSTRSSVPLWPRQAMLLPEPSCSKEQEHDANRSGIETQTMVSLSFSLTTGRALMAVNPLLSLWRRKWTSPTLCRSRN